MNARGAERGGRMVGAYIGAYHFEHGHVLDDEGGIDGAAADLIADVLHAVAGADVEDPAGAVRRVLRMATDHFESESVRVDDSRRYLEGDTLDPRCTGYIDDHGYLAHDGDTCPVHEAGLDIGDGDPGDETTTDNHCPECGEYESECSCDANEEKGGEPLTER